MKKILGLAILAFATVVLVACTGQNLDGEYYRFYTASNTGDLSISEELTFEIDGDTIVYQEESKGVVDSEEKSFKIGEKVVYYVIDGDVITVGGENYVKKGSKKYDEILKEILENENN